MEDIRTIKGVNREVWLRFKELAAKKGMKMGDLFENMVKEHSKKSDDFWSEILSGEKRLTDKEAEDMNKTVKKLRKEWGFRNVPDF